MTSLTMISPAGHGLTMTEFHTSFDGVTSSAVPVYVEALQSTQAVAGTATAATPIQVRGRATGGSAPTGGSNYTVINTVLTSAFAILVPAFNGVYTYQFPLGREIECDSSAGTIKALGLAVTAPAAVNTRQYLETENL